MGVTYARTGYLGFLRRTENIQADGTKHNAVFIVGSLDETIMLRGEQFRREEIWEGGVDGREGADVWDETITLRGELFRREEIGGGGAKLQYK